MVFIYHIYTHDMIMTLVIQWNSLFSYVHAIIILSFTICAFISLLRKIFTWFLHSHLMKMEYKNLYISTLIKQLIRCDEVDDQISCSINFELFIHPYSFFLSLHLFCHWSFLLFFFFMLASGLVILVDGSLNLATPFVEVLVY